MYVIYGIKHRKGTYEGNNYDNYNIGAVDFDTELTSVEAGGDVDISKVKRPVLEEAMKRYGIKRLADLIGIGVEYCYDKYQNVSSLTLIEIEEHGEEVKS